MYFRPGVRWIPTYRIELAAKARRSPPRSSLQAELLNEAEDLKDVPLDIVVGVPNFRFRTRPARWCSKRPCATRWPNRSRPDGQRQQ